MAILHHAVENAAFPQQLSEGAGRWRLACRHNMGDVHAEVGKVSATRDALN